MEKLALESLETISASIADDLLSQGYSIRHDLLPMDQLLQMYIAAVKTPSTDFHEAAIGRQSNEHQNPFVRRDHIIWLDKSNTDFLPFLTWIDELRLNLSRQLMLSLPEVESQLAHYGQNDFYKKHLDAFKGNQSRIITHVLYLNPDWSELDGGELVMYHKGEQQPILKLLPKIGTMIFFMSERFPHEVLPAHRDRYSIASWMRQREL